MKNLVRDLTPCISCKYFDVCGDKTRIYPCSGWESKKKNKEKKNKGGK